MRTRDKCRLEPRPRDLWRDSEVKTVIRRVVWEGVATGEYPTGDATIDSWVIQRSKLYISWEDSSCTEGTVNKQDRLAVTGVRDYDESWGGPRGEGWAISVSKQLCNANAGAAQCADKQ